MEKVLFSPQIKERYQTMPSKSVAIRALILAAFCDREIEIVIPSYGVDVSQTVECLKKLGVKIKKLDNGFLVTPGLNVRPNEKITLDCKESATLYRFFSEIIPSLNLKAEVKLTGSKRLIERVTMGSKTSQNISGKLIANAITGKKELISIPDSQVSKGYIDLTKSMIKEFFEGEKFTKYVVEGDYSIAANYIVLGALSMKEVAIENLNPESKQPDKRILDIIKEYGTDYHFDQKTLYLSGAKSKRGRIEIDGSLSPDLVPILSILASFSKKTTIISNIDYLRYKESDRIESVKSMINRLGGNIEERRGSLVIKPAKLSGGRVDSNNDHRIVMAASIASAFTTGMVKIENCDAVKKTYPDFFKDFLE